MTFANPSKQIAKLATIALLFNTLKQISLKRADFHLIKRYITVLVKDCSSEIWEDVHTGLIFHLLVLDVFSMFVLQNFALLRMT